MKKSTHLQNHSREGTAPFPDKNEEKAPARVIFLDRDGTMNEEVNYLHRPEDLRMIPGTAEAVRMFNEAGYQVIVITNQAGVARGYYTEADVEVLHAYMNEVLEESGAHVDAFYYCPHHPEHGIGAYKTVCRCRKPNIGMFEAAERELPGGIDKSRSFMIGDKLIDTEAGHRFGIRSILVGTGYGAEIRRAQLAAGKADAGKSGPEESEACREYDAYAENLLEAAKIVLA